MVGGEGGGVRRRIEDALIRLTGKAGHRASEGGMEGRGGGGGGGSEAVHMEL